MKGLKHYISKILNRITDLSLSKQARHMIHKFICEIILILLENDTQTISLECLKHSIHYWFSNELQKELLKEGDNALTKTNIQRKGLYVIPHTAIKKAVKEQLPLLKLEYRVDVYLGACIEYLLYEILSITSFQTIKSDRRTIYPRDVFMAIMFDEEFLTFCKKAHIVFENGFSVYRLTENMNPYLSFFQPSIHPTGFGKYIQSLTTDSVEIPLESSGLIQTYIEQRIVELLLMSKQNPSMRIEKVYEHFK